MASEALCIGINRDRCTGIDLATCVDEVHDCCAVLAERALTVHKLPDAHLPLISHSRHSGTVSRAATGASEDDGAPPGFVPTAGWLPPRAAQGAHAE